jgi:hypothetical protein
MRFRCLALLFGVLFTPAAWAQGQLGDNDSLSKAFYQNEARRKELVDGTVTASGAADKKIAEAAAKWYIYRISHASVYVTPGNLAKVHAEFNSTVANLMEKEKQKSNRAYVNLFGAALVESVKDVLKENATNSKPQVYVHACMMLPTMAKLKQDDVGDYLLSLVGDPKVNDVARLHAVKGLREYLPVDSVHPDVAEVNLKKKARDVKLIDTLGKYIEGPINVEAMTPEEAAAVNYLRREAIITLALAESPAVAANKKAAKIEGGAAPTLMRVIAGNLEPAPTLQEKIEAAVGLCKMRYWNPNASAKIRNAHFDEYKPELAVYLVGKTLDEFIGAYKADYDSFSPKDKSRKVPRIAFKAEAKRFEAALTELVNNAEGSSAGPNAQKLKAGAAPILADMGRYLNLNNDQAFRQKIVPSLRPKNGYVFQTLKTAEIPLTAGEP